MNNPINIIALAKLEGIAMAFLGLGAGLIYSVGGFFHDLMFMGLNYGTLLAFMALIGMPLMFGTAGIIAGIAHGIVCNILSAVWGIEFRITKEI